MDHVPSLDIEAKCDDHLNRELRSTILGSAVYCQSKEAGCEWVGKLDELSMHLKEEYSLSRKHVHIRVYFRISLKRG